MPNKTYQDSNYYARPPCAQQSNAQQYQYPPLHNNYNTQGQGMYDYMYSSGRNQYNQSAPNLYDQVDNWLPDSRVVSDIEKGLRFADKMETIEISSKDLSPVSCCSNIDLLLPDIYKTNKIESYTNKNYTEYPSCSQMNCEQDCTGNRGIKYCNIEKNNFNYDCNQYASYEKDCNIFSSENAIINVNGVYPPHDILQFDPVPCLEQQIESSNESDIVVEESDEDYADDPNSKYNCLVCNLSYSTLGNQFHYLTPKEPRTMSSQKPVYTKLKELLANVPSESNYLCNQCLGLINTMDHLELKLDGCRTELSARLAKNSMVKTDQPCSHNFDCKICKKTFSVETMYKNHLQRHKTPKRFLCEVCGRCFGKLSRFKVHSRVHHGIVTQESKQIKIKAYQCKICSKPFRTGSNLKEHENYCSGKLPYKCRHCNKNFATCSRLKNHTKLKHDKKFTCICSICNIGFVNVYKHKAHLISHSADKKFPCSQCDKTYKTLYNLKFHMKFHDEKLSFICSTCGKGFMRREYLESHITSHTGEKKYPCTFCDRRFKSQKCLDAHLKYHDGNYKKKKCNICGKLISKHMEDHLRNHANLKEFECDNCDMRFNTRNTLLKHMKRKHRDKVDNES